MESDWTELLAFRRIVIQMDWRIDLVQHRESELTAGDGTRLFAQSWVPDADAIGAVAIVHGLGEHSGRYAEVAEALGRARYAVMGFDLRGHGRTGGQRGHVGNYGVLLDDIGLLIEKAPDLCGRLPVFLYGHSLGGNLVLNYALRRQPQIAGLVVASPLLRLTSAPPLWKRMLGRVMNRIGPRFSLQGRIDPQDLSHDPSAIRLLEQDPLVHRRVSARLGTAMLDTGQWALDNAGGLALPTLLMHGSADPVTSPDASAEFARRAGDKCAFRVWEGLYHELHWETKRDAVIQVIIDWLQETG